MGPEAGTLTFSEGFDEIRTGFERPFWVANISELFERLSYYAAFASLARYLHETLNFRVEQASSLTGLFGGLVWFLAVFGGTIADRLGFRRSLSLAYLILSCSYFLLGSIGSPWLAPLRNLMPLGVLVTLVLMLPALGVALVKPCVVGTTARASKENVRSIGYSIYYTLVNIGGAAGPYIASWVHQHMRVENVFRVAALSVFAMFFAVLLLFKEPRRSGETQTLSLAQSAKNFVTVISNPRFMLFLLIFSGYWVVYWQEFIILPLYIHDYIDPKANTELLLVTGPLTVIALQLLLWPGVAHSDRTSLSLYGISYVDRRLGGRDHAVAALLRVYFAARAIRTAGDVHGLCLPAHRNRVAGWGLVWRQTDPLLWRGGSSTRAHLVGGDCRGRCHSRASVALRQDPQTRRNRSREINGTTQSHTQIGCRRDPALLEDRRFRRTISQRAALFQGRSPVTRLAHRGPAPGFNSMAT